MIADDSTLLREGLAQLLREASFDVVATVGDGRALIEAVATDAPDLILEDGPGGERVIDGHGLRVATA